MSETLLDRVVFTDANILINLIHLGRLDLLGLLEGFDFVVPEPVAAEISDPSQREAFLAAVESGHLTIEALTDLGEVSTFAELRLLMGDGEAACLAMGAQRGALVATSDKKRKFRREARRVLGDERLINLTGLIVLAVRQGLITVDDADGYKDVLEQHRFRLKIKSFGEILEESTDENQE